MKRISMHIVKAYEVLLLNMANIFVDQTMMHMGLEREFTPNSNTIYGNCISSQVIFTDNKCCKHHYSQNWVLQFASMCERCSIFLALGLTQPCSEH